MADLEEGELEDGELLSSDEEPELQGADSQQHKVCNYPIGTLHLGNCITAILGMAGLVVCAIFSNMAPVYMCSVRNVLTIFSKVLLHLFP